MPLTDGILHVRRDSQRPSATLLVASPYDSVERDEGLAIRLIRVVHLAYTFDHRIISGPGANHFLNAVRERITNQGKDE